MKLDFASVLTDGWALFRRDRDLLLRVAAPFLFLPAYALALVVPAPPLPAASAAGDEQAQALAWADALSAWGHVNAGWYALAYLFSVFGTALVFALYLDRERPDLRQAFARAFMLFPRLLLVMIITALPIGAGLLLWALPGLYILGRTMLAAPALIAEAPVGAWAAIRRSLSLSRGAGLALMGLAAFSYLSGWLIGEPFQILDRAIRASTPNPVLLAIVDAGIAAASAAASLAMAMIAVAAYRRVMR